jgi:DNA-binding NarL/FixJ family response regulator
MTTSGSHAREERDTTVTVPRVLIVDDQTLFRSGLVRLLEGDERLNVVGEARDGVEAVQQVSSLEPDIVLMDL